MIDIDGRCMSLEETVADVCFLAWRDGVLVKRVAFAPPAFHAFIHSVKFPFLQLGEERSATYRTGYGDLDIVSDAALPYQEARFFDKHGKLLGRAGTSA